MGTWFRKAYGGCSRRVSGYARRSGTCGFVRPGLTVPEGARDTGGDMLGSAGATYSLGKAST
jgi:hypothetical protein